LLIGKILYLKIKKIAAMKKLLVFTFIIAFMIGSFSCSKYEDGPTISLNTKTKRLCREWKIQSVMQITPLGETDVTDQQPEDFTIEYKKDDTWSQMANEVKSTGTWEFSNDKVKIRLKTDGAPNDLPIVYVILRLKNDELWYLHIVGDTEEEFHLIAK